MTRRWMLAIVALAVVACSSTTGEAQPKLPRVGVLSIGTDPSGPLPPQWAAFFDALRTLGYVEDRTIRVQRGFAGGDTDRLVRLAKSMVEEKVDVLVVTGNREVHAARQATTTIPIVTIVAPDPVASGLVTSLGRPGGNITGLTFSAPGVGEKYVELLRQAVPSATRVTVLASRPPAAELEKEMRDAARALHVMLAPITFIKGAEDLDAFFARARRDNSAVIAPSDGVTVLHRRHVVAAALKHRVPAIYPNREFAEAGGLMTYGPSFVDLFRRAATFVDKILKGAKPADLPMEQPIRFELVMNLKTARTLGLSIPRTLQARVDEVIE
ncbi:MAG TPA: ABC transporter substrate-binding protein [Methylomirabilota bacterium]|nr:ABC transporter substrate-binding protein [Methylomirabilota bacterium]